MSTPTIIAISNFKQILTAVFKSNWVADRGEITKDINIRVEHKNFSAEVYIFEVHVPFWASCFRAYTPFFRK